MQETKMLGLICKRRFAVCVLNLSAQAMDLRLDLTIRAIALNGRG
jgi:hypothetical protein